MADTVASKTLNDGPRRTVVHLTNSSDGTGESAVTKVDISALSGAPAKVRIGRISWSTRTMGVDILFDASTDQLAWHCAPGTSDQIDFEGSCGGLQPDSAAGGFTGDIQLTTIGHASGARYSIVLELIKD